MQVQDIMTRNPACCAPETTLREIAMKMQGCDCGEIPVLDEMRRPIGVVTDRDICIRAVAAGMDVASTTAREIMSSPVFTVSPGDSLEDCCRQMEEHQVRRVPVVDGAGACCGIVAQADIARSSSGRGAAEMLRDISRPAGEASRPAH